GSILAGTSKAEDIEGVTEPVKDLFGAVFFISVGMMVDPQVIAQYWTTIALLSVVVIVGMIVFGTFGMLATGQPLKIAMESGFSLTQIGEFAFIIASLGMSLGVLDASIYPIVVAVSVITTFFTPFFIRSAVPCYNWVERHLPGKLNKLLEGYAKSASETEEETQTNLWVTILKRFALRIVLYTSVTVALIFLCRMYLFPALRNSVLGEDWGNFVGLLVSFAILSPFFYAIISPAVKQSERDKLIESKGSATYVPLVVMFILSVIIDLVLVMSLLYGIYSSVISIAVALVLTGVIILFMAPVLRRRIAQMEKKFIVNVNERDLRRTGKNNNLVSDLHLAYMTVGQACGFAGEKLKNADLRRRYGVNVVSIQRAGRRHPVPTGDMRVLPGDIIGVIGNDEQILALLPIVEAQDTKEPSGSGEVKFTHFAISENSPLIGKKLSEVRLREDYASLLVSLQRNEDEYLSPTPELVFDAGDVIWIVGDPEQYQKLK
ncbi:MAG: cation:proton antiporter, partial [Muribaculaceae bacterium]|nr:cation:proton antiporter [Muribaculaceae bacterium]